MAASVEADRWTEIRTTHKSYAVEYQIGMGLALVIIGVLIGASIFANDGGFPSNVYTEVLSVIITILVLDKLAERRETNRRVTDLKKSLVRDAGSQSNEAAKHAVEELAAYGWLRGPDGLLKGKALWNANLQGADLREANLQRVNLRRANLQGAALLRANLKGADLWMADLQNANLWCADLQNANLNEANLQGARLNDANLQNAGLEEANLQKADLMGANLQDAHLFKANLQGVNLNDANLQNAGLGGANLRKAYLEGSNLQDAHLFKANLQGVNLNDANLEGTNLYDTEFDTATILPDGTPWTPETDLTLLTNPPTPEA